MAAKANKLALDEAERAKNEASDALRRVKVSSGSSLARAKAELHRAETDARRKAAALAAKELLL